MLARPRHTFLVHVHPDDETAVVEDVQDGGSSAHAAELADIGSCIGHMLVRKPAARPDGREATAPPESNGLDHATGRPRPAR